MQDELKIQDSNKMQLIDELNKALAQKADLITQLDKETITDHLTRVYIRSGFYEKALEFFLENP